MQSAWLMGWRCCQPEDPLTWPPLNAPHEAALMQRLSEFPEIVDTAAQELAPHMIANYLKDLASDLHSYYNAEQFSGG